MDQRAAMPSAPSQTLAALLLARRQALGLSRPKVSELADVRVSTLESWEIGRVAKPPIHDVFRLARVLGISAADLESAVLTASGSHRG